MNFLCDVSQVPGHKCRVHMNIKHQCTPFAKSNGRFFPDTKIIMTTSSNLYNFWWVHEMHAIGHFLCKIYWLFALTRSALGGLNAMSVLFFKSSWTSSLISWQNLTDSSEIFLTSNLICFLNLTQISWRLAPFLQSPWNVLEIKTTC